MSALHRRRAALVFVLVLGVGAACGSESADPPSTTDDPTGSSTTEQASAASDACDATPPPEVDDGLPRPEVRASVDGVLETTLRASYGPVEIDGQQYQTLNFEGSVPGPTLAVCPGDTLIVHFENDLGSTPDVWLDGAADEHGVPHDTGQHTNLHTHGLNVSPTGNGDNVFLDFAPGETFTYEYQIPADHPPGTYWYHPHRHGFVEPQVYAGMYGVIYVKGSLDDHPAVRDAPTRTMVISSMQLGDGEVVPVQLSDSAQSPYFLNGQLEPTLTIRPGEVQRWRILNANDNAIVRLGLEGHQLHVVATDGNTTERATAVDELLIGPGERREVLVQGGPEGSYAFESLEFAQFQGDTLADSTLPASTIATLESSGAPVDAELPGDVELEAPEEDLRAAPVGSHHEVVFSERERDDGQFEFLINGDVFDPDRVDALMALDEVAEWQIVNETDEWHTFHIHVNDYQVVDVELQDVDRVTNGTVADVHLGPLDQLDTVKIPPRATVTMRTRPINFTGKFVFHCHMLFHEDRGMMGVAEVQPS